jgi:hypothetical protein
MTAKDYRRSKPSRLWPAWRTAAELDAGAAAGQSANRPHRIMSWPGTIRSIGLCSSVIRWELVEFLRWVSIPVRGGNRNVATAILS